MVSDELPSGGMVLEGQAEVAMQPYGTPAQRESSLTVARATWHPAGGAHAVVKTSAIVSFSESITSVTLARLTNAVRESAREHGLTTEAPVNSVMFEVGPGAVPKAMQEAISGTAFQEMRGTGIAQSLVITSEAIRFETAMYTRWVAFEEQLVSYMSELLPIVSNVTGIKAVALEYVDLFVAQNEGAADASLIIDRKSDYVSRKAFKRADPFHVHVGWFEKVTDASRLLVNVDVTASDAEGPQGTRRTVTIRTHEAAQVIEPFGAEAMAFSELGKATETFAGLHRRLKAHLAGVLTKDAQDMISLRS